MVTMHGSKRRATRTLTWIARSHSHIYINTVTTTLCEAPAQLLQTLESNFYFEGIEGYRLNTDVLFIKYFLTLKKLILYIDEAKSLCAVSVCLSVCLESLEIRGLNPVPLACYCTYVSTTLYGGFVVKASAS